MRQLDLVQPDGTIQMSTDQICIGETVSFAAVDLQDVTSYSWDFGDGTIVDADAAIDHRYTFVPNSGEARVLLLVYTGNLACETVIDTTLRVVDNGFVKVPNAFTPNNDGRNDFFNYVVPNNVDLEVVEVLRFQVFNRWGQLVYDNEAPEDGWDGRINGKEAPEAVYAYNMEVRTNACEATAKLKGNVTLLRER